LAKYAIARPEQIDARQALHADGHVAALDEEQIERYAMWMNEILEHQTNVGRDLTSIACEVLSTLPYPLQRVLNRHGLGRFRVTQKLNLHDPADVYRIENAEPRDWIMLGTHDTPPIWRLADEWVRSGAAKNWGSYLAGLYPTESWRTALTGTVDASPGGFVNTLFTAMLASRARNVVVFFPDLFGMTERYNEPGLVSEANWSLRLPSDFEDVYARQLQGGRALDLARCFQRAAELS
jgi:4-alpha-glucanotransferase